MMFAHVNEGDMLIGGRGGMVDATDLKSVISNGVRVRVPPSAPAICSLTTRMKLDCESMRCVG